jgi:hypothetical protein
MSLRACSSSSRLHKATWRRSRIAPGTAMSCSRQEATAFLDMLPGPMARSSQTRRDARGRPFGDDVLGDGRRGDENDEARSPAPVGAAASCWIRPVTAAHARVGSAHERVRRRD